MLTWISELLYSVVYAGPARNAPNSGINIKKYIEEKPPDVVSITKDDLEKVKLTKVETNNDRPKHYISPMMAEFQTVFDMGCHNFLEKKKQRRVKILSDQ